MANVVVAQVEQDPMEPYTANIIQWLRNLQGNEAREAMQGEAGVSYDYGRPLATGILSLQEERTGNPIDLPERDVAIFCDTTRLVKRENEDRMFDTAMGVPISYSNDGCSGMNSPVFMYTTVNERKADTIQICPWFLQYAKAKKYGTNADIKSWRARLAVLGMDKLLTKMVYKPIDLMSLWDKCMLHEMMHTKNVGNEGMIDVEDLSGYGWKNCRKMADGPDAEDNADTHALIGSALYWGSLGSPVDINGKFPAGGSSASKRWLGSGSGRALDAVKAETSI
ncbi:hypothetical protein BJ166DRAFT_606340 [Pestalotiopsis sp. NC0098]|nr:hypothetical protein BJ166DRAFT_606340 [Pestalotiopsis sp. NC0098]